MIGWGVVSMGTMFITDVPSFMAARVLLGIAEAGFFPGMVLYPVVSPSTRASTAEVATFRAGNLTGTRGYFVAPDRCPGNPGPLSTVVYLHGTSVSF